MSLNLLIGWYEILQCLIRMQSDMSGKVNMNIHDRRSEQIYIFQVSRQG